MERKTLIGIKLIAWLQVFIALAVLFTLNINSEEVFNVRFAVPFTSEIVVQLLLVVITLVISYGYLKQTKWGYWSMLIYSIAFCFISLFQPIGYSSQPIKGNFIYAGFIAIYTFLNSKYFIKDIIEKN